MISGLVAFWEGTFTSKVVRLGFMDHGGMWSDLLLLPTSTAILWPLLTRNAAAWCACIVIAAVVTLLAHRYWYRSSLVDGVSSHMFSLCNSGRWYAVPTVSGWMHVVVMLTYVTIFLLYVISPIVPRITVVTSCFLTVHIALSMIQPAWHCNHNLRKVRIWIFPVLFMLAVWAMGGIKIQLGFRPIG